MFKVDFYVSVKLKLKHLMQIDIWVKINNIYYYKNDLWSLTLWFIVFIFTIMYLLCEIILKPKFLAVKK